MSQAKRMMWRLSPFLSVTELLMAEPIVAPNCFRSFRTLFTFHTVCYILHYLCQWVWEEKGFKDWRSTHVINFVSDWEAGYLSVIFVLSVFSHDDWWELCSPCLCTCYHLSIPSYCNPLSMFYFHCESNVLWAGRLAVACLVWAWYLKWSVVKILVINSLIHLPSPPNLHTLTPGHNTDRDLNQTFKCS